MNTTSTNKLVVEFVPQHWIGHHAIPSGPAEPVDATATLLAMCAEEIRGLRDGNAASDNLVDPVARAHFGPYAVRCQDAVSRFFGVADVRQVTDCMLESRRAASNAAAEATAEASDEDPQWLLVCGVAKRSFACRAPSIEQAIASCGSAYPGQAVVSAMCATA